MGENELHSMQNSLTKYIELALQTQVFPGGGIYVEQNGEVIIDECFGYLTYKLSQKVDRETIYDIASQTKLFTWMLMFQCLEEGLCSESTTISELLPQIQLADITVYELLTHTTGVRENFHEHYFCSKGVIDNALAEMKATSNHAIWYNCANSILAGMMVEQLRGKPLDQCLREYITEPLDMKKTQFGPIQNTENLAPTGICPHRGMIHGAIHDEKAATFGRPVGNAGIFSTLDDMKKFMKAWQGNTDVISQNMLDRVFQVHVFDGEEKQALGWLYGRTGVRGKKRYEGLFAHSGFTGAQMVYWKPKNLWITILSNRTIGGRVPGSFSRFVEGVLDMFS